MTEKQKIAQYILHTNSNTKNNRITLLYTPVTERRAHPKNTIIITSIPKKIVNKAAHRNKIRRQLKLFLRQTLSKELLNSYYWMWIYKNKDDFTKKYSEYFKIYINEQIVEKTNN